MSTRDSQTLSPTHYQIDAAATFLVKRMGGVWNWDMGSGKTIGAFLYLLAKEETFAPRFPVLITAPTQNIRDPWLVDARKVGLSDRMLVLRRNSDLACIRPESICLVTHEKLGLKREQIDSDADSGVCPNCGSRPVSENGGYSGRWCSGCRTSFVTKTVPFYKRLLKQRWSTFIIDESHKGKNKNASRSQAFLAISRKVKDTLLLTGTFVLNRTEEVEPAFKAVSNSSSAYLCTVPWITQWNPETKEHEQVPNPRYMRPFEPRGDHTFRKCFCPRENHITVFGAEKNNQTLVNADHSGFRARKATTTCSRRSSAVPTSTRSSTAGGRRA